MAGHAGNAGPTLVPGRSRALWRGVVAGLVLVLALPLAVSSSAQAAQRINHQYVTDTLKLGSSVSEADGYALDLDGNGSTDNALGRFLIALSPDQSIAASIQGGSTVILHSLQADSLRNDRSASWHVYLGKPRPNPVLSGGGRFTIDRAAPAGTDLAGSIVRGQFTGGPGVVYLRLGLVPGRPPIQIQLVGARIQADCTALGCANGKIGGGLPAAEVNSVIIPALAEMLQQVIDASCTGSTPDTCTPAAANILALFDTNGDLKITPDELRANSLIAAVLAPDVDLLKANGRPGHDGVADSLSLGLGFTAKTAVFAAPQH
jgi:hypothetical protein